MKHVYLFIMDIKSFTGYRNPCRTSYNVNATSLLGISGFLHQMPIPAHASKGRHGMAVVMCPAGSSAGRRDRHRGNKKATEPAPPE